jgi:hypothetical protein
MLTITTEKDDFTGLRTINSNFFGLSDFITFSGPTAIYIDFLSKQNSGIKSNVIDAIDLMYIEHENGQGNILIRVVSALGKYLRNSEWPHWDDNWPMIIDGERINISSSSTNSFESSYELKVYDLPVDVFNKICNAKEVKYSLRGRNSKVEGAFSKKHQEVFQAFEQFCFGDESEGNKIIETLYKSLPRDGEVNETSDDGAKETWTCFSCSAKNIVPKDWSTFSCHKCGKDNTITRPIKLSPEDIEKHENKTVELIKEKKVSDAIKYYAANFGESDANSKIKVKELAEKNGVASIILADTKKKVTKAALALLVNIPILIYLWYWPMLPISQQVVVPKILWYILIILFGILTLRAIIKLFKK